MEWLASACLDLALDIWIMAILISIFLLTSSLNSSLVKVSWEENFQGQSSSPSLRRLLGGCFICLKGRTHSRTRRNSEALMDIWTSSTSFPLSNWRVPHDWVLRGLAAKVPRLLSRVGHMIPLGQSDVLSDTGIWSEVSTGLTMDWTRSLWGGILKRLYYFLLPKSLKLPCFLLEVWFYIFFL